MPRPPTYPVQVPFRVSARQARKIEEAAEAAGLIRSEWIRRAIDEALERAGREPAPARKRAS